MRWKIAYLIYVNIMRRSTCTVDLDGDTAISTIRLNSHDRRVQSSKHEREPLERETALDTIALAATLLFAHDCCR